MPRPKSFPKNGGRQKDAANKRTREIADEAATHGLMPLEYILSVVRDPSVEPERRDRMAVAAAPYIHPRLAAIEAKVDTTGQLDVKMTREELDRRADEIIDRTFREWKPQIEHQDDRANGAVIEPRSSTVHDGDRSEPVAEADHPTLSRDFARPSSFEAVPGVAKPSIPRRPRPVGSGWAG